MRLLNFWTLRVGAYSNKYGTLLGETTRQKVDSRERVKREKSIKESFRLHLGTLRRHLPISLYILCIGSRETSIYFFTGVIR